jgi:lysophospholipase L1-like esterase
MIRCLRWPSVAVCVAVLFASVAPIDTAASEIAPLLPHVAQKVAMAAPLKIVAFGSSSTEGIGASSPATSYPSRLPKELSRLLPAGETVTVINRGIGGEQVDDMLRRLQKDVVETHPDLVIWQLGSNDALQDVPVTHFNEAARSGIDRIRAAGIDILLMEPQDCPVLRSVKNAFQYRDSVRRMGSDLGIPVLRRYDLMAAWLQTIGPAILAADGLHMSDIGYAELASATARIIVNNSRPDRKHTAASQP